ncbi:MAG: ATP-grasp domain-containing protein [Gaiellaceae bacterium]
MDIDALVLDLDTRAGLCIARSLGRAGYAVAVAARDGRASGLTSRYVSRRIVLPDPAVDFHDHTNALLDALASQRPDAALPSIDSSVEVLHTNRDAVGRFTAPALGSFEAVEIALSKERTIEIARSLGVPVPRSTRVENLAELEAAVADTGLPCVLKPDRSWRPSEAGGERLSPIIVRDAEEARRVGAGLVRDDAPVLVQEFAVGGRETIKLFREHGRTLVRMAMLVDRAWPPLGGSSVMRRTVSPPVDVLDHADRLVAEVGLDGYSEVEFRRDASGRPLLMEINPRISQSVEVAVRAGVDFPRMQFEWARGGSIPDPPAPVLGLRVGWLAGDLRLLTGALGAGPPPRPSLWPTVSAIASDYVVHHARIEGFDRRDRKPVLGSIGFALRSLAARNGKA